jgi:hypothetical protein
MATRFYSSVEYGNARPSTDPDVLYFNATINNNNASDPVAGQTDPQVTASYQRTFPLIQDASDYMMSVVRMSTNGATRNLPLLIPQIQESTIQGTQWLAGISGNKMTINSTPTPNIAVGQAFVGSGTAILVTDGGARVGSVPYTLVLGADGKPITLAVAPPAGESTWTLSSTPANGFWPGGNGYDGGYYKVLGISNGSFFVGSAQDDIDATIYSFTIVPTSADGVPSGDPSQVFVEWETQEPSVRPPASPVITQELGNEYYYCYSYDWWVMLCNKALARAWLGAGAPGTSPPQMYYFNTATGATQFAITPDGADWIAPGNPDDNDAITYRLYMNSNMANLFNNFPGVWENRSAGRSFQVYHTTNYLGSPGFGADGNHDAIQEFASTSGWTPVDALVLTTSALPITAEQTTPPSLVGASDTGYNRGVAEAAFQPILLDVTKREITGADDWRQNFVYEATGEYRMVSLTAQTSPIANVDILAWWRNRLDDALYPLRLSNGSSLSVKIMFRRKQMGV